MLAFVPVSSGVYYMSNARGWIYIGESENLQARLLEHLAERGTALQMRGPTLFSFEVCGESERYERQNRLVFQHEPVCNRLA